MGTSTFGRIPATAYSQTCLNAGRHDGNGLIRRSFSAETRPGVVSRRIMHPVAFGDRIYARLMSGGRTLMEFSTQSINDLSELWGLLRRQTSGLRGLVRLYIRNMSRGWTAVVFIRKSCLRNGIKKRSLATPLCSLTRIRT